MFKIFIFRISKLALALASVTMLTESCSLYHYDCNTQANDHERYLQTPSLRALIYLPNSIFLPEYNNDYEIPTVLYNGKIGKKLDIRPPKSLEPLDNFHLDCYCE
ncbi:outer membrane protein assembly factor BamC [Sodalis sp. CWE]|uniref:outer membrane protein assembly factor BamC n=1 Tax=Sodalis sp. CWE TaxID=2803816 RepID=UPI001C7DF062|nr:outer membrane protein assembly factor BamC [Sodalis sp. CWE]MBX4181007.1 outer membrane protein assembly factor BamC [Sodalis sp. CWE]